ncbi:hypothetical protein [Flavobacterium sp.]|uniref:hypothetical protein n=1 Tax=Flavobacterium sp. TaxID=239 RepID=UPI003D0C5A68
MKFTRKDLYYDNYSWSADGGDDSHYKGYLDRIKVDKTEGYEVVYFCNDFLVENKKELTKENFQRVEKILKSKDLSNIELRSDLNYEVNKNWNLIVLRQIING